MWEVAKAASWLVSPLGTAAALLLLSVAMSMLRLTNGARRLAFAAAVWLWLWATPIASHGLISALEAPFPPQPELATVAPAAAAVALGGAIGTPSFGRPFPSLTDSSDRLWFAARLYRAGRVSKLVLSGGSDRRVSTESEAQSMQTFLLELGVPRESLILEGESRTTRENAQQSAEILRQRGIDRVVLVTSAFHMRRAVGEFESAGLEVVPFPVGHAAPVTWQALTSWVPDAGALQQSGLAMKEFVGLAVAMLRARS